MTNLVQLHSRLQGLLHKMARAPRGSSRVRQSRNSESWREPSSDLRFKAGLSTIQNGVLWWRSLGFLRNSCTHVREGARPEPLKAPQSKRPFCAV